jgi:hypothetical protein
MTNGTAPRAASPVVPIVAIAAGVACFAGAVVLTLASHPVPPELWVAGTGALTGGLGMAVPGSSSSSSSSSAAELAVVAAAADLAKVAVTTATQPAATPAPGPVTEPAAVLPAGPATVAAVTP